MVLNFGGFSNQLFSNSREEELGFYGKGGNISTNAVKSFIVNGVGDQYTCTTSWATVTGMELTHTSKTGRVMVIFSASTAPGIDEAIYLKLQKDGTDVTGTEHLIHVGFNSGSNYWSCVGAAFTGEHPDVDNVGVNENWFGLYYISSGETGIAASAPVDLPHGAVVTGVICYGSETDETWYLERKDMSEQDGTTTMATAVFNTEDTSISNATIDNVNYAYFFHTTSLDGTDQIRGARITYTEDPASFADEGQHTPCTIHIIETNADKDTWKIVAKRSNYTPSDCFINDRIFSIIDI